MEPLIHVKNVTIIANVVVDQNIHNAQHVKMVIHIHILIDHVYNVMKHAKLALVPNLTSVEHVKLDITYLKMMHACRVQKDAINATALPIVLNAKKDIT